MAIGVCFHCGADFNVRTDMVPQPLDVLLKHGRVDLQPRVGPFGDVSPECLDGAGLW